MRYASSIIALALLSGCQELDAPAATTPLDEAFFRCEVQPVLTKSCGAFACHGDAERYYTIFSRNRLRFGGGEEERNAQMREQERAFNYQATSAQVDPEQPDQSWLLLKPLDEQVGGYFHGGETQFGMGDVFTDPEDPDLETLREWVLGATAPSDCVEPGSNQ